jgi:YVTN family beta-propeller protein
MTTRNLRWFVLALALVATAVPAGAAEPIEEVPIKGWRGNRAAKQPGAANSNQAPMVLDARVIPGAALPSSPLPLRSPGPNLRIVDFTAYYIRGDAATSPFRLCPGGWIYAVIKVVNTGDSDATGLWTTRFTICDDPGVSTCHSQLVLDVWGNFVAPGDTLLVETISGTIPTLTGLRQLAAIVDVNNTLAEDDETDNVATIPVHITDLPDLDVSTLTGPASIAKGDNIGSLLRGYMINRGCADAVGPIRVTWVLSTDAVITSTDFHLSNLYPGTLTSSNSRQMLIGQVVVPSNAPQGEVYWGMIVDRDGTVSEYDEANNYSAANPITVNPAPAVPPDTSWVYFEDFQDGDGGWTPKNFNVLENHWNRVDYDDNGTPRGVMWCGDNDPTWATPPGYGNSWVTQLTKSFDSATSISYTIQYDTEPAYDYVCVQISQDNFDFDVETLRCFDGSSGGAFLPFTHSIVRTGPVQIRFRFGSDGSWSDQDGLFPSNGACRLDFVQVNGTPTGSDVSTFDTTDDGWVGSGVEQTEILYRLEQFPACDGGFPCDSLYVRLSDDLVTPVRRPINICSAWVAYDASLTFPYRNPVDPLIWTGIESPPIAIPADRTKVILRFDTFANLTIAGDLFYTYHVSFDGGLWQGAGTVFYGTRGWQRSIRDITSLAPVGATSVRIRIGATELNGTMGVHSASPFFDNVAVGVVNSASVAGTDVTYLPRTCDTDHDGVLDAEDACPNVSAAPFDKDGDGCRDASATTRNVEFWTPPSFPVHYRVSSIGPTGLNFSEVESEVQAAFAAWTGVSGAQTSFQYDGLSTDVNAVPGDGVNLVTFNDPDYPFPNGVLAVGVATSYTARTHINGEFFRPGQIRDSDMIFNTRESFRTPGSGPPTGVDLRSVAVHEAGHVLGLSHSAVQNSTMFYVLPQGTHASTLEPEDISALRSAYPDPAAQATLTRLAGRVVSGYTGDGVPGVIVYVMSEASGDTVGCTYTLGDGSYNFSGIDASSVYIAIHALDGSSDIGFITQDNINDVVAGMNIDPIVAEFLDVGESSTDDPAVKTAFALTPGSTPIIPDLVTNVDATAPALVVAAPADGSTNVPIDGALRVTFSEAIDNASVSGNFKLRNLSTNATVGGNAAFFDDDRTLSFIPTDFLEFQTSYQLELLAGLADQFGNTLGTPVMITFTTQAQPPVSISSLAPSRGVAGTVLVINGFGFDELAGNNLVSLGIGTVTPSTGSPSELVVTVPADTPPGTLTVSVTNLLTSDTSNEVTFTVLPPEDVARGFTTQEAVLSSAPRSIRVPGVGNWAFVATGAGVSAVNIDRTSAGYLQQTDIPITGGVDALDVTPDGKLVFAISRESEKLYRINADLTAGPFALLNEHTIRGEPLGIVIEPSGQAAYIAKSSGAFTLWDVRAGFPTFDSAIDELPTGDLSLQGKFAIHPKGDRILALSGTGKLHVIDLASRSILASISVGTSPEDVSVDPLGERAYVTDSDGFVTVVSLETLSRVVNITTGGSLRGVDVSPSGSFLFAVDHELNFLNVVDLRASSSSFGTVAARTQTPVDPADVELSSDGLYAYSVVESGNKLVVTSVGVGPVVRAMSKHAGPVGSKVVLTGSGFTEAAQTVVTFNGADATTERSTDGLLVVSVPAGATSGPVVVEGRNAGAQTLKSNSFLFEVLGASSPNSFVAGEMADDAIVANHVDVAVSPAGKAAVVLADDGTGFYAHVVDTDPLSGSFHRFIGSIGGAGALDAAISSDGSRAYILLASAAIRMVDINPLSDAYLSDIATVDLSTTGLMPERLTLGPDGGLLLVSAFDENALTNEKQPTVASHVRGGNVIIADVDPASATAFQLLATVSAENAGTGLQGTVGELAFHPGGAYAYVPVMDSTPPAVRVLDVNRASATFGTFVSTLLPSLAPGQAPKAVAFTPDGSRCVILASPHDLPGDRMIMMLDTTNPAAPQNGTTQVITSSQMDAPENIFVSPRGDRVVAQLRGAGLHQFAVQTNPDALSFLGTFGSPADHTASASAGYSLDGTRFYAASASSDQVRVYAITNAQSIAIKSGDGQTGVVNTPLPLPLEIQVGGGSLAGVLVRFSVAAGGGMFSTGDSEVVVPTDANGVASVEWILGPSTGPQSVDVSAGGLAGSPLTFGATALADPNLLPLTLVDILPATDKTGVGVTTTILASFSRAVDPSSITANSLLLTLYGQRISTQVGFADGNRKVSLTPDSPLDFDESYAVNIGDGIRDMVGGALTNPQVSLFTTESLPPLDLIALSPQSGTTGIQVSVSGSGFAASAGDNTVVFDGNVNAVITSATPDALAVTIPVGLAEGEHTFNVQVGQQTSASLSFNVLVPSTTPFDQVTGRVGTSSETRAVAIAPNGRYVYAVAPSANAVIVLDLKEVRFVAAIPVGDNPYAIAMHPHGTVAYVANLLSSTVSIIDIKPASPNFNKVIKTLRVGLNPTDMAVTGTGDRLFVANFGSADVSIIDANTNSESYHQVTGTAGTGTGTRAVAVTPDGGRLYVGTSQGYIVIETVNFGVIAGASTGTSTKSISVTPDGTLAIVLSTQGFVLVFDIAPGSQKENQVVGQSGTGTSAKSVSVSPDGGLAFIVTDQYIIVVSLNLGSGVAVLEEPAPPTLQVVTTITAGENPAYVAFDPSGSGTFVVTNSGDNSISIFGSEPPPPPAPEATVLVTPETFNRKRKAKNVGALVEFVPGYSVQDVDVSTVYLHVGTHPDSIKANQTGYTFGDADVDSVADLSVKFDATAFSRQAGTQTQVFARVTGTVDGRRFEGGSTVNIQDSTPGRLMVLERFTGVSEPEGAMLRWITSQEDGLTGFNLARSASEDGPWVPVNSAPVSAQARSEATGYECEDPTALLNRTYYYKLSGLGVDALEEAGPFRVVFRAPFELAQNAPNPFNPSTRIRFTLAEDGPASLVIYDVAGRRVRTLFDESRRANRYTVVWDGRNDHGEMVASGVYFSRLVSGPHHKTRKMLLLK